MRDKVIQKMTEYIEQVLDKVEITRDDYNVLQCFLALLDSEESKQKMEENSKRSDERLASLMSVVFGKGE